MSIVSVQLRFVNMQCELYILRLLLKLVTSSCQLSSPRNKHILVIAADRDLGKSKYREVLVRKTCARFVINSTKKEKSTGVVPVTGVVPLTNVKKRTKNNNALRLGFKPIRSGIFANGRHLP